MKKTSVVLGSIFTIIGLIITLWSVTYRTEVILSNYTQEREIAYEVSYDNFEAGNRLIFEIIPGENWYWYAEPKYTGGPFPFDNLPLTVAIIDPKGGVTNLTVVWAVAESEGINRPLIFFAGTPTSPVEGITMEEKNIIAEKGEAIYYNPISGIVKYDGTYKAVIYEKWLPTAPKYVRLKKQQITSGWPYLYVAPIGGAMIGIGIALPAWTTRKPKHLAKQRNRK